jgi:excisionase family DNA binding protein
MPESGLLTVAEAAALLRLKPSTLRAWILRRRLPYCKVGRRVVRIRRADVEALIAASVVPARCPATNVLEVPGKAHSDDSQR